MIIGTVGLFMTTLAEIMAPFLVRIFVGYDQDLFKMTCYGFQLYSFSFLVMGFNIWSSGFFTALGDGVTSAILAFLRTLVFQVIVIYTLPYLLGIDGIWLAVVVAEVMALFVTIYFLLSKKNHFLVGSIE